MLLPMPLVGVMRFGRLERKGWEGRTWPAKDGVTTGCGGMGVRGNEGGVCNVRPAPETQSTAPEGGEGKGNADWVEGLGEGYKSADHAK